MWTYDICATEKSKWHNLRWKVSNTLIVIAKWVYPENPEVYAFLMKKAIDEAIYGRSITHINNEEIYRENAPH